MTDATELLSEIVHTAFRKGCDNGTKVWTAMRDMPREDWGAAIEWMVYALGESGYEIVEKKPE